MKFIVVSSFLLILIVTLMSAYQTSGLKESMARGAGLYTANCATCHMTNGKGIVGVYPPLAKSDYLMGDKTRAIKQVLEGAIGSMTVNGVKYNGFMTGFNLTDKEVSDVLNYIRNSWGNKSDAITPAEVQIAR